MRLAYIAAVAGPLVLASGTARAHIAMTYPAPRTAEMKAGPCGTAGSTRSSTVTTFSPGQKIVVEWNETIGHPGHYRIAFDDDGDDVFKNPHDPADNFTGTLAEPIADRDGTEHYTQEVTLPNVECTNCTLQLMQVMTTVVPYNSFYYQCADITLVPGGGSDTGDPPAADGGCSTGSTTGSGALVLAGLAALAVVGRRQRAR